MTDRFMDGYDDPWGPAGRYGGKMIVRDDPYKAVADMLKYGNGAGRYGGKLVNWMVQSRAGVSVDDLGEAVPEEKFNNEGEKQMEKIDWHKPLRALNSHGEPQDGEARTYKSGKQRVVWVNDRVYPVDDQGHATAEVWYRGDRNSWPRVGALKGSKLVENVPEKFFLGLRRLPSGTYVLTDGGVPTTMSAVDCWKGLGAPGPRWVVDTRKSAEPPKAHDPKDWAVVFHGDEDDSAACDEALMTKTAAELRSSGMGTAVRVRVTPTPVDTSRYIQLWRISEKEPWKINALDGRQEFTWAEVGFRAGRLNDYCTVKYCTVKVRD